jgi:hypothetical protein
MDPSNCVFPPEGSITRSHDTRGIKVGDKVCVKTFNRGIAPAVVTKVNRVAGGQVWYYTVAFSEHTKYIVSWILVGTYPHKVSATAVDVLARGTNLNDDVIGKIKGYGRRKKTRKARKSRRTTRKR